MFMVGGYTTNWSQETSTFIHGHKHNHRIFIFDIAPEIVTVDFSLSENGTFRHPKAVIGNDGTNFGKNVTHGHITHVDQVVFAEKSTGFRLSRWFAILLFLNLKYQSFLRVWARRSSRC
ncbi:hypothetical protein AVEN_262126-1 [Araneus ventricosus]|uniref:Uncharacterized protein n=1 Tax=Araneus ventricosus TaxID=182803 RepID=A0A4Y2EAU3_ARAVE|nr:hypothetical protein AVEN_262126-1 [Araneus ventricosus]